MIVEVPFVYERRAREPGKRKYVPMKLRSVASVRLGEIAPDAFPVAIAMDRWDAAAGIYRHDAQYRVHEGALHVALLGYGPARHTPQATLEAMLAHIAKGCRTDLSRGLPQHEPTFRDPAVEATLHLDPDDPGDRDELAAEIARNAAATLVCEGALWRRIHDEPLLVAIPADRVNGPMLDVRFKNGRKLGKVEENFGSQLSPGDTFFFAGMALEVERVEATDLVVRATAKQARFVSYMGARLAITSSLAERVRAFLHDRQQWPRRGRTAATGRPPRHTPPACARK